MNAKQNKLAAAGAILAAGWWLLARPSARPLGYPYMGQAGGAGPGQTGSGGKGPGQ